MTRLLSLREVCAGEIIVRGNGFEARKAAEFWLVADSPEVNVIHAYLADRVYFGPSDLMVPEPILCKILGCVDGTERDLGLGDWVVSPGNELTINPNYSDLYRIEKDHL